MENYTITKEQILQLNSYNNYDCGVALKEWFPTAFKQELEVGKWYKYKKEKRFICYITENGRYGFDADGDWFKEIKSDNKFDEGYYLATPQEVGTALINEAKRRGFKDGCIINNSPLGFPDMPQKIDGDRLQWDGTYLNFGYRNHAIFKDGKWAEIIEQPTEMTVAEIEAKLGYSIKIVK